MRIKQILFLMFLSFAAYSQVWLQPESKRLGVKKTFKVGDGIGNDTLIGTGNFIYQLSNRNINNNKAPLNPFAGGERGIMFYTDTLDYYSEIFFNKKRFSFAAIDTSGDRLLIYDVTAQKLDCQIQDLSPAGLASFSFEDTAINLAIDGVEMAFGVGEGAFSVFHPNSRYKYQYGSWGPTNGGAGFPYVEISIYDTLSSSDRFRLRVDTSYGITAVHDSIILQIDMNDNLYLGVDSAMQVLNSGSISASFVDAGITNQFVIDDGISILPASGGGFIFGSQSGSNSAFVASAYNGFNSVGTPLNNKKSVIGWDTTGTSSDAFITFKSNEIGLYAGSTSSAMTISSGDVSITDAADMILGSTTGTKIGTATTQKIGFYNATPVDQPAAVADPSGGAVQDAESRTAIIAIIDRLIELGLIAP